MNIIGLMLVKNEDRFVKQALVNILCFCDHIYVEDNWSEDRTFDIVNDLASKHTHITLQQGI